MKLLYVSGSLGLGHITRDLAIARAARACHTGPAGDLLLAASLARGRLAGYTG